MSTISKPWLIFTSLFILLILAEICCIVPPKNHLPPYAISSVVLFLSSVCTGLLTIGFFYKKNLEIRPVRIGKNYSLWISLLIWIIGLLFIGHTLQEIFLRRPIDPGGSDIIPTLQLAVTRYLTGVFPYQLITEWGYELPLTYLPMQWGPYILAEVMKFDYRWIAFGINALAGIWVIRRSSSRNMLSALFIPVLFIINWVMIIRNNENIVAITIETMVAGYYMMLVMGLAGKNAVVKGLMIGICLMSRYSLVLWLPLWLFIEAVSGNRKQLVISLLVTGLFVTIIYIIPFLSHDPSIFMQGYKYYSKAALGEWTHVNEQQLPYHLYNGQGFAWLFFEKLNHYSLPDRIKSLQKVHLLLCLLTTAILGLWYWFNRKNINHRVFILASFKIYLSVFLAFIQVPYAYLMITGTFVSIAILAELMRYNILYQRTAVNP